MKKYIPQLKVPGPLIISIMLLLVTTIAMPSTSSTKIFPSKTYSNPQYGFEIQYPKNIQIETTFRTYYHLSDKWSSQIFSQYTGTPVIAIPLYRITNTDSSGGYTHYPLYFAAELRIGVSSDSIVIANYLNHYPTESGTPPTTININGILFHKFNIEEAGMSQYLFGYSYRTLHNGKCYFIELLKTGSSYRDNPHPNDIPDKTLNSYFNNLGPILKSFRFIK